MDVFNVHALWPWMPYVHVEKPSNHFSDFFFQTNFEAARQTYEYIHNIISF